jgi:hypothetical protein
MATVLNPVRWVEHWRSAVDRKSRGGWRRGFAHVLAEGTRDGEGK